MKNENAHMRERKISDIGREGGKEKKERREGETQKNGGRETKEWRGE